MKAMFYIFKFTKKINIITNNKYKTKIFFKFCFIINFKNLYKLKKYNNFFFAFYIIIYFSDFIFLFN